MNPTEPTFIILDEVQVIYHLGSGHPFWKMVKDGMQNQNPNPNLGLLCLAAYGEMPSTSSSAVSTPVAFQTVLGLQDIILQDAEYRELIVSYNNSPRGKLVPITPSKYLDDLV